MISLCFRPQSSSPPQLILLPPLMLTLAFSLIPYLSLHNVLLGAHRIVRIQHTLHYVKQCNRMFRSHWARVPKPEVV
jgi:hypothetical protein